MKRPQTKDKSGLVMFGHKKGVNEDGSVRFRFTEKAIDRYDEVVIPSGARLDNYKKNPIALWAHGFGSHESIPIGKTDINSIEITDTYFDANIIFDDKGEDDFAKMIADKVRNGFLNAVSIGFRSITTSKEPVLEGQRGVTFWEWELFEISVCAVPALPSALITNEFSDYYNVCRKQFGDEIQETFTNEAEHLFKKENNEEIIEEVTEDNIESLEKLEFLFETSKNLAKMIQLINN